MVGSSLKGGAGTVRAGGAGEPSASWANRLQGEIGGQLMADGLQKMLRHYEDRVRVHDAKDCWQWSYGACVVRMN